MKSINFVPLNRGFIVVLSITTTQREFDRAIVNVNEMQGSFQEIVKQSTRQHSSKYLGNVVCLYRYNTTTTFRIDATSKGKSLSRHRLGVKIRVGWHQSHLTVGPGNVLL